MLLYSLVHDPDSSTCVLLSNIHPQNSTEDHLIVKTETFPLSEKPGVSLQIQQEILMPFAVVPLSLSGPWRIKNSNMSLEVLVISIIHALLQMLCRLSRVHCGWACFEKNSSSLVENRAEEWALRDLFAWAGCNRRSSKTAEAQACLKLELFCYDRGIRGYRSTLITGASGGCSSEDWETMELLSLRAAEKIALPWTFWL